MRRALLISLSLVLALAGWSAAGAQDGFYVIPSIKVVPKTGQTTLYGTGDDGDLQKGLASPIPRFTDNNNGTVTDNLTRLIWMKDASAIDVRKTWADALLYASNLAHGSGGLTDGSKAGDWRLPNVRELQSLVDYGNTPTLPADHLFINVALYYYCTSTTPVRYTDYVWFVYFGDGTVNAMPKGTEFLVWCVRGGL